MTYGRLVAGLSALVMVGGCKPAPQPQGGGDTTPPEVQAQGDAEPAAPAIDDAHSYAEPSKVVVRHIGLDWNVDFDTSVVSGSAYLLVERIDEAAPLVLDTRGLRIQSVETAAWELPPKGTVPNLVTDEAAPKPVGFEPAQFELGEPHPMLGQSLTIQLPPEDLLVKVVYETTGDGSGLQWLSPEQTAGRKHPFLYSQSQAIHARSIFPCQDSPGIRVTYDAKVTVPSELVAVMSAEQLGPKDVEGGKAFEFVMPQPIPSYLIAIGVGDLAKKDLGPRSAVYADPKLVDKAAYEFADTEKMMDAAGALYGDYDWGRYDILVLPPAFPFGGMENPRLTFATPTILAGDRSLTALIAHELAHSWSGNLVTNATWPDLWLNEGFTVYFERRIVEEIYGPERATAEAMLGKQDLEEDIESLAGTPGLQQLAATLEGEQLIDPDDNFTDVPYEKGALFLKALEEAYGRERFDVFLNKWFDDHRFQSVSSPQFVAFLEANLLDEEPLEGKRKPDPQAWVYGPGIPEGAPDPKTDAFLVVDEARGKWIDGSLPAKKIGAKSWTVAQMLHFLRGIPRDVGTKKMGELDKALKLTKSTNNEILHQWLVLAALNGYAPAEARIESFLIEVGRRKFLTPLYEAILAGPGTGEKRARAIYAKARPGYHAIARRTLDDLMGAPE